MLAPSLAPVRTRHRAPGDRSDSAGGVSRLRGVGSSAWLIRRGPNSSFPRRSAATDAAEKIKALITEGSLVAGSRLPPERDLCLRLAVSRPTLREAIRSLGTMGVLQSRQGAGTYVTDLAAITLAEPLRFMIGLNSRSLVELADVRRLLESGAAELAAEQILPEELAEPARGDRRAEAGDGASRRASSSSTRASIVSSTSRHATGCCSRCSTAWAVSPTARARSPDASPACWRARSWRTARSTTRSRRAIRRSAARDARAPRRDPRRAETACSSSAPDLPPQTLVER